MRRQTFERRKEIRELRRRRSETMEEEEEDSMKDEGEDETTYGTSNDTVMFDTQDRSFDRKGSVCPLFGRTEGGGYGFGYDQRPTTIKRNVFGYSEEETTFRQGREGYNRSINIFSSSSRSTNQPTYIHNEIEMNERKSRYLELFKQPLQQPMKQLVNIIKCGLGGGGVIEEEEEAKVSSSPVRNSNQLNISKKIQGFEYEVEPPDLVYDLLTNVKDSFITIFELIRSPGALLNVSTNCVIDLCYEINESITFDRFWKNEETKNIFLEVRGQNINTLYDMISLIETQLPLKLGRITERKTERFFFSVMLLQPKLHKIFDEFKLTAQMVNRTVAIKRDQIKCIHTIRNILKSKFIGFDFSKFLIDWKYDEIDVGDDKKKRWLIFYFSTPIDLENAKDEISEYIAAQKDNQCVDTELAHFNLCEDAKKT